MHINRNRMLKGYGYTACVKLGNTVTEFDDNRDATTDALSPRTTAPAAAAPTRVGAISTFPVVGRDSPHRRALTNPIY